MLIYNDFMVLGLSLEITIVFTFDNRLKGFFFVYWAGPASRSLRVSQEREAFV